MATVKNRVALILAVGIVGGGELGKVPIALPVLSGDFGLSLVEGGLLLGMFQVALMAAGIVAGMMADRFGQRRVMAIGLVIAAIGSALGAMAGSGAQLLASRAVESAGFMAMVLPGPALLGRMVDSRRLRATMGLWACYMPTGMGLVLLLGPIVIDAVGWRALWWAFTLLPLGLAALVWHRVEPDQPHRTGADGEHRAAPLVIATLTCPGCWLLAGAFACYAGQWMSVFGFLPTFYRGQGLTSATAGLLTAIGALVNVTGNFGSGLLLQRGIAAHRLLLLASLTMLACAWILFGSGLPFAARYAAVLAFSAVGGLIPGTLFALTHRYAPTPQAVSTTTGLMQQGSSTGQFIIPPVLAAVVSTAGGWSLAWTVTGALALVNIGLALTMRRRA